jgi:4-amino-4-deoxy-L-arabinose transferase-like glycosyltransferase
LVPAKLLAIDPRNEISWWSSSLLRSIVGLIPRVRIELFAIVLLGLAALTAGMREAPLVNWDEATYAEVAHEAVDSNSYLHLTWNGDRYLKKPPLLFWLVIGSFRTFGESAWAARLPSVAAGIGTLLLLYFSAAPVVGRLGGMFAGILPLGFYFFIARGGRECATDGPLVFFSTLAVFALVRARTNRRWLPVVGVAIGLAILSKGLAGILPLGVTTLTVLLVPGFGAVGVAGLIEVAGLTCAVIAPWLIYEMVSNGALFWEVFVKQETLSRVASHVELQRQTATATLPTFMREVRYLWVVALPLGGLVAAAVERGWRLTLRQLHPAILVWLLWLALGLAAACAVRTKLGWYVLPALIPTALLCGSILGAAFAGPWSARGYLPALAALALVILGVETPAHWRKIDHAFRTERERSGPSYALGMRARALGAVRGDRELFFAGVELPTLVYYSGMRAHFMTLPSGGFPDLAYHQLAVREADGALLTVGNFDDEWNVSGPPQERGAVAGGVCHAAGESSPSNDLRLSLLADDTL